MIESQKTESVFCRAQHSACLQKSYLRVVARTKGEEWRGPPCAGAAGCLAVLRTDIEYEMPQGRLHKRLGASSQLVCRRVVCEGVRERDEERGKE